MVNQAFDDNVIIVNSESQLSQNHVTPKQQIHGRQGQVHKTHIKPSAKSPQPLKLSGGPSEMDIVRPSPSQINQLVHQRELRNNSTMAIANTGGVNVTGGSNSVLSQSNNMGMTKRHLDNNGSSKWLPAVSNEKKMRGQGAAANATHTIQIGKGEI